MDETRRTEVASVIETLGEEDLAYAEAALQRVYAIEIDRKDKILSSMTVVSTPLTILFAGVAFLTNNFLDASQAMLTTDPDVPLALFYAVSVVVALLVASVLYNAKQLLGGENYFYLPNADDLLDSIARNKEYCLGNGLTNDGQASRYVRLDTVLQLAECATRNASANDIRLMYRQRVYGRTVWAIVFAALGFVLIALHHQKPDMWHLSRLWRGTYARSHSNATDAGPDDNGAADSNTGRPNSGQARPASQPPAAAAPIASPAPGRQ